jgi:hypothetical protein
MEIRPRNDKVIARLNCLMRTFLCISACVAGMVAPALCATTTALEAVKLLPKEARKSVARIEAREGSPNPERWHILVNDKAAENGFKEYVVADGAIVAERSISQFVESISPHDAIGDDAKFDSDRAAQLVRQYAQVNAVAPATIDYQLRKDGAAGVPLWRLTCYDDAGKSIGMLTLTATKGVVISHQGFPVEPSEATNKNARDKFQTTGTSTVVRDPDARYRVATPIPKKAGLFQRIFGGDRDRER